MKYLVNEEIKAKSITLITEDGTSEHSLDEALEMAYGQDLDLVQVNAKDGKCICKIMDYSKFMYNKQKAEKKSKKSTPQSKEVRFDNVIAENDMRIKAKQATRILNEGSTLKVDVVYRGRAIRDIENGAAMLETFKSMIETKFTVNKQPKIEGNRVVMVLVPSK